MIKYKILKSTILILTFFLPNIVFAATIEFNETNFLVSTVTTSGINLSSNPDLAPALPDDATFILPADSTNLYLATSIGKFLRFDFTLPNFYSNIDFLFNASVNDEYALYINGIVVAIQSSTGTDNFASPLPGFYLATTGTATDTSGGKLEYLRASGMQSYFHTGVNELTLFGTDTLAYGGFNTINGVIGYDVTEPPPNTVPEPTTVLLVCFGMVFLIGCRKKFAD